MKRLMCLAGLLLIAFGCDSSAATITKSATAPAVNDEDLANFGTQTGTDKWWPENSATGAAKGQTFRTRNEALRFKAVTYRITTSVPGTKVYTIRLGKISGTTFTPVYTESATQTVAWAANDYVTWRLATPLVLQPNTFYGVDVALKSSTTDWQDGIPYISMTADEFSDGVSYISGTSGVGNGTITASTEDRRFHLDIEKPIGGWTLVATDPADNSANAYASNPLFATFSQNIVRGTGNLTLKNLTDGVNTVIPITDARVLISENLLTVNPGTNYLANKAYAVRIDSTAITNVLGANYPGIANDTTWNFSTGAGDPLYLALVALKKHITGATPLTATQIAAHKTTIDQQNTRLADSAALITASFDLVKAYDASSGNHWYVNGLPARDSVIDDIHWTLWNVQQYIMDVTYNDITLASYESVLNGFKFGSASSFPGACTPPANSNTTHTVTIKASYANTLGWTTQGDGGGTFARKPTGCYLAPGSIATVTVPAALVGKGFKIRVGAHSWDFSNKPLIKRLDRSTILYPINAVETKIACPHGGGIYIEVPWLANQGIVNVSVRNAVRSPYFSAKSFHQTTPTEWLTERTNAAPWADFQSDKFMIQVPRSWIYAMPDPTQLMKDWDAAMDAVNDLLGFPQIRGKESFYLQVDVLTRASVYAPGYPAVNVGGYSATANYNNGYNTHFFIRGPQYGTDDANVEFHEQGHGYSFDKFPGETESNVNLPFIPVLHRNFGTTLDAAFRASLGEGNTYRTLETTAMAWMTVFNFSPREVEMADAEKAYQLKGHAKFVDIARIYGWGVLGNYWKSFVTDYENGVNYGTDTDSLLLRLSKNVGADIRPLFHFWGIYPQSPATLKTAIANANLVAPVEIYDRLVRYKSLVPPNNSSFTNFAYKWWSGKPSSDGYWEEREHASQWDIYNENSALGITNRVQELLNLYYPNGRPTTITSPVIIGFSPADNSTNVALEADFVVTFNKAIVRGTGNITLTNLTDGTSANITVTDTSQISIVGEVLTINRTANLLANKTYAIRIAPTAIGGLATNSFAGITNNTTWNFTTINPDVTAPTIVSLTPSDGAANVALGANLVATFSEPILRGTGNITLKNLTDVTQTTIAVTNTAQVSVSGAVLTVNPTADLIPGKTYAIQIAATAIDDLATNSFAGISNDTTWNFTVIIPDVTAPTIVSLTPSDGATNVTLGANLVATFSEPILRGSGNITLKNLTDATQTTIAVTNTAQVSVSSAVLTINPTALLSAGKTYAVQIAATAIDDLATNSFAGIANDTTWNFTTLAVEKVPPVAGYSRWFDASGLALTNGAFVTSWSDGSASAADATVPSGNAKPRFVTDSGMESGHPVIYFAKGTDATYSATNSAALRFTSANSVRTIFSIFKGDSFLLTHASTWHFHRPTDTDPTAPLWHGSWTSASIRGGQTYVNGDLVNGLTFNLSTNLHNGFNLVCVVTTNAVQADSFNKDRNFHSGNQYQAEVILYDRVLDDTERKVVEAYLINKWFSSPASDYSVWAANWPSANLSDPNADFDNDGQSNENERLWGLNPKIGASRTPFASITDLAAGTFIYTRRTPALTGYSYAVWTSTNLVDWTQDVSAVQTPGVPVSDIETVTVTLSPSLLTSPTLFLRLRATLD